MKQKKKISFSFIHMGAPSLLMIFLVLFPLFSRWRRSAFESRRWNESDLGGDDEADEDE